MKKTVATTELGAKRVFDLNRAFLLRSLTVRQRALCILGVILIVGALLRIHGVERRTLDHPEVYAPGIDLAYHLTAKPYRFVGRNFAREVHTHPGSRVWVLSFPSVPTQKEVTDALARYRVQDRVDALNISASLYVAKGLPANGADGQLHVD